MWCAVPTRTEWVCNSGPMSPLTRPARAWLEERTERLVEMVNERGLTLGDDAARHLLTERVCAVAEKMRIGIVQAQRYLTDDAMRALVDGLVEAVEEEEASVGGV